MSFGAEAFTYSMGRLSTVSNVRFISGLGAPTLEDEHVVLLADLQHGELSLHARRASRGVASDRSSAVTIRQDRSTIGSDSLHHAWTLLVLRPLCQCLLEVDRRQTLLVDVDLWETCQAPFASC